MQKFLSLVFILSITSLKVSSQCDPAFTATVQQATVHVQAVNTAPNLFHSWNSRAGFVLGASATFTFYAPGTYSIVHRVVDSLSGCEDSIMQTVTITYQITCAASFTATRDSSQLNRYHFSSTSVATGTSVNTFLWILNGSTVISFSPSFSYTLPVGLNTICLSIGTTGGSSSTTCESIVVTPADVCSMTASFTATPSSHPRQISFIAHPSSSTFLYDWSFGDGSSSLQQNPNHTYAQAGAYDVRLRVYDPTHVCFDTIIQNMVVHGLPSDSCTASFNYTAADPSHPNQISFTAISNQTITSQTWWINHGSDSILITANNPTYTFTDTGYYYVCLYITTNTGCTKWYCNGIYIDSIGSRMAGRVPSYPNPARNIVNFRLNLTEANRIGITVYNTSGYIVYQTQKQGNAGSNEINIPVEQLNSGQYFIDIQYGNERKRSIFQKL